MHRQESRYAADRECAFECGIAGGGRDFSAPPNKQQAGQCGPERRASVKYWRGKLVRCNRTGSENQCQRQETGSGEAPRSKKTIRIKTYVWCDRRRHYSSQTSDAASTDHGLKEWRDLRILSPTKQEVAGNSNQGRRANTHSGHFAGANVVALVFGRGVKGRH